MYYYSYILTKQMIFPYLTTMWYHTDGFIKKYHFALAVYLLQCLALEFYIIIDRALWAPGHEKYVYDSLNVRDKWILKLAMETILDPGLIWDDPNVFNFMQVHEKKGDQALSVAKEAKQLLWLLHTIDKKSNKKQENYKFSNFQYHIQEIKDVQHKNVNMTWDYRKFHRHPVAA